MLTMLVVIFVAAYAVIALEHPIEINKPASALLALIGYRGGVFVSYIIQYQLFHG